MKKQYCIIIFIYCISASAENSLHISDNKLDLPSRRVVLSQITNNCFIYDDGSIIKDSNGYVYIFTSELEKAKNTRECLPATEFPEGNWGEPKLGYHLSLRFSKNIYSNWEPVIATILVRNLTNVWLDFHGLRNQMGGPISFSVTNSHGEKMQVTPYSPGILSGSSVSPQICIRAQWKFEENLSNGFVLTNDTYHVQAYIDVPLDEAGTNADGRPKKLKVTSASVAIKIGD